MPNILAGKTNLIVWADTNLTLSGSAIDVGTSTVFYFDGSSVRSFRAGRNPALNSLTQLTQWEGYQISATGGTVTLPETTLGFGNEPSGQIPQNAWLSPSGGPWQSPSGGYWLAA